MALTFAQIRSEVAAFTNRAEASFVIGSTDVLKRAVNRARSWAELRHNFELSRLSVDVPSVSLTTGGPLSGAVDHADGTTPVRVKVLERAFLSLSGEMVPVDLVGRPTHVKRVQRRFDGMQSVPANVSKVFRWNEFSVIRQGGRIYVSPPDASLFGGASSITVYADAVKLLPDYVNDNDTDFFLDFCVPFMLYRSLYELNLYLKEDARIPISKDALADAWDSVIQWDTSLIENTVADVNLD